MISRNNGRYETIGRGYARARRPDPRIQARIDAALGEAATVLNVGAGTGSYEPADRRVVAAELAQVMLAQRPAGAAPAVRAVAEALPFGDLAFDAALAVCTVHHWRDLATRA
jgi:ubiquinone/menaquinone biosynthesis C-methylase UbiE